MGELCRLYPNVRLRRCRPYSCSGEAGLSGGVLGGGREGLTIEIRSENLVCRLVSNFLRATRPGRCVGSRHVAGMLKCVHARLNRGPGVRGLTSLSYLSGSRLVEVFGERVGAAPLGCVGGGGVRGTRLQLIARATAVGRVTCRLNFSSPTCFGHVFGGAAKVAPVRCHGGGRVDSLWLLQM